jgi:hypothetical protein
VQFNKDNQKQSYLFPVGLNRLISIIFESNLIKFKVIFCSTYTIKAVKRYEDSPHTEGA